MMETKAFEIRDTGTFIPVIATQLVRVPATESSASEFYLLRRSGYSFQSLRKGGAVEPVVMLCRLTANGGPYQASCDPYGWGQARTLCVAHQHIAAHWDELKSGQVIDIEFILGETKIPKLSEALDPHE